MQYAKVRLAVNAGNSRAEFIAIRGKRFPSFGNKTWIGPRWILFGKNSSQESQHEELGSQKAPE